MQTQIYKNLVLKSKVEKKKNAEFIIFMVQLQ